MSFEQSSMSEQLVFPAVLTIENSSGVQSTHGYNLMDKEIATIP